MDRSYRRGDHSRGAGFVLFVAVCSAVEKISTSASLFVFPALFILVFIVAWKLAVTITERCFVRSEAAASARVGDVTAAELNLLGNFQRSVLGNFAGRRSYASGVHSMQANEVAACP